jgi:hypothetical protein
MNYQRQIFYGSKSTDDQPRVVRHNREIIL